jgi:hypothetical protein
MPEDFANTYFVNQEETFYRSRFRALLECLSDTELMDLACYATFDLGVRSELCNVVNTHLALRTQTLKKTAFLRYIHALISGYRESKDYHQMYGFVMLLRRFMPLMRDESLNSDCSRLFLGSKYSSIRSNGYKLLDLDDQNDIDALERAFNKYHDAAAYQIIVELNDPTLKEKYFEELFGFFSEYGLWRLYKNIEITPERLEQLEEKDEITYVYVCAARGERIEDDKALRIWDKFSNNDKRYILLSSFGKMKLWNVITKLSQ